MGNYKSRPVTSCSETWKNRVSENYALVRRRINEDLCHLKDVKTFPKKCEESCCSNQRLLVVRHSQSKFEEFKTACIQCCPESLARSVNEDFVNCRLDSDHFTPLHYVIINSSASKDSQISSIKLLISYGAKTNSLVTRNLFSPLHLAVFKCDSTIVSLLLDACIGPGSLDLTSSELLTPLHLACLHGSEDIVSILLEKGAYPNYLDAVKFSPMHIAIYAQNDQHKTVAIVKKLVDFGAKFCYLDASYACKYMANKDFSNSDEVDAEHIPILLLAASRKQVDAISFLLCYPQVDVNTVDLEQNTALHVASKQGHVSVVRILLEQENIQHLPNVYEDTPLHLACYAGKIEIAQLLIAKFGTSFLEHANVFGETPLHASCTFGLNLELIKLLLSEKPLLVNYQAQYAGHTPLHSCSFHGHFEAARLLVQNGADVNLLAKSRDGPLVCTPDIDHNGTAATAVAAVDSSLNSSDNSSDVFAALYQDTCAEWAAENGHDELANWLNQCRSNGDSSSYRSSGGGTENSSYVPLPSRIGKLKSVTQEKIGVLSLRAQLPKHMHIDYSDIERLEHIGSGGFGKVYKSRLRSSDEIVAVKVYKHRKRSSKTDIDMFVREVKILCQLDNPYIVKFYGVCLDDASNFSIITEFCANGSLCHFLHKQKRCLDLPGKLVILQNVASGMNYLHTLPEPVIHRDLNSFNILLRESMNAVVADFGESRFIDRILKQEMLTKQPGNLRWMSPEIFNQSTEYNTKADVYNFSLCIWELLSGEVPFAKLTPLQAAQEMAVKGSRPPVSESYPDSLVQLMKQCWSEDPAKRPDFASIVKQLNDILLYNQVNASLTMSLSSPTASFAAEDFSDRISVAELRSNFEVMAPNVASTNFSSANTEQSNHTSSSNQMFPTKQFGSFRGAHNSFLQSGHSGDSATPATSCSSRINVSGASSEPMNSRSLAECVTSSSVKHTTSTTSQGGASCGVLTGSSPPGVSSCGIPPWDATRFAQNSCTAMANGYVCDTSQPRLLMAAVAQISASNYNNETKFNHQKKVFNND